jgi:putative PIN family toxin of toxin-antitoxin system
VLCVTLRRALGTCLAGDPGLVPINGRASVLHTRELLSVVLADVGTCRCRHSQAAVARRERGDSRRSHVTAQVLSSHMLTVVLDTNVLVAALLRGGGTGRAVLRACLQGQYQPVLGPALLAEYEDVLGRSELFADSVLSTKERGEVFDGLMSRCRWVEVFYAWRPNLPDEADNHLIELAVAAQADAIVTRNLRDVARGELKFPTLRVLTPEQCLEAFPCPP